MKNPGSLAPLLPALAIFLLLAISPAGLGGAAVSSNANPPRPTAKASPPPLPISTGIDRQFKIPVGPPDARIAVWTLEPKAGTPIKGTVIFLHGFLATHTQVQNAGEALRRAGCRAVLVDLRGFGESTGDHITFGVLDAQDMKELADALQKMHLCGPTLGVYGTSYGAASAILYAALDPRVSTVIAVAPFATIRDEVPRFSRQALGDFGGLFTDGGLNSLANAVSSVAGMDLDDAKPIKAIAQTQARILLIHGDADSIIPDQASKDLHAADPGRSELLLIPNRGHLDLCFDIPGQLQKTTREWFDRYLDGTPDK